MQLLEVKNNTAKILYNPEDNKLLPSDFLLIEDANQRLAGQILNLYADETSNNNIADVRLALTIDKDDRLSYYNGYIPPRNAKIIYITADDITEMIADSGENIYMGSLTYHPKSIVKVPMSLVDDRLFIQCGRDENTKIILQNIVSELYNKKKKVVLFDFDGRYSRIADIPRIAVSENFKFPLNIDALDSIFEYDTQDCSLEDKAVIQSIVLELKDYVKTIDNGFLPLTLFKDVVVSEFASNPISGLMLLRNKLWQYSQDGLFAEKEEDFNIINDIMQEENIVIADVSKISEKWHKFTLQTIPKILKHSAYLAFSLNDIPMDKRSIMTLYNNPNITPVAAAAYDYPHRELLKSLCKNQILFKPAKYASGIDEHCSPLISKLNADDFILYGSASLDLALIVKLKAFDVKTSEAIAEHELRRNVDKILYRSKSVLPKEASVTETQTAPAAAAEDTDFTDEDLDFLDSAELSKQLQSEVFSEDKETSSDNASDLFDTFSLPRAEKEEIKAAEADNLPVIELEEDTEIHFHTDENEKEDEKPVINTEKAAAPGAAENIEQIEDLLEISAAPLDIKEQPLDTKSEETEFNGYYAPIIDNPDMPQISFDDEPEAEEVHQTENEKKTGSETLKMEKTADETAAVKPEFKEIPEIKSSAAGGENAGIDALRPIDTDSEAAPEAADETAEPVQEAEDIKSINIAASNSIKSQLPKMPAEEHKKFSLSRFNKLRQKVQKVRSKEEKEQPAAHPEAKTETEAKAAEKPKSAKEMKETKETKELKEKKPAKKAPSLTQINKGKIQKKDLTVYEPEKPAELPQTNSNTDFKEGDKVYHPKYGIGVIEGFAKFSSKINFCSVEFESAGRRMLDLSISPLQKLDE